MFSLIGGLTHAGLVLVILYVMVRVWLDMFMLSSDPVDVLIGLIIAAGWGLAIRLGVKKGLRDAEEMGLT
jgi:membrane protein DedA with SNARE-associated domain